MALIQEPEGIRKESLTNNMQRVQVLTMDAACISAETCIHVICARPWLGCTVP